MFTVRAGSMQVVSLTATAIFLSLLDRLLLLLWHCLTGHVPTPLQRIGLGQVPNAAAMAASALVERRRSAIVHAHHAEGRAGWIAPMSAPWLVLPPAMTGVADALHFPGPGSALLPVILPVATEHSNSDGRADHRRRLSPEHNSCGLIRRATYWLPDNINTSRLKYAYLLIAVLGMINFGYYLLCAQLYDYRRVADMVEPDPR